MTTSEKPSWDDDMSGDDVDDDTVDDAWYRKRDSPYSVLLSPVLSVCLWQFELELHVNQLHRLFLSETTIDLTEITIHESDIAPRNDRSHVMLHKLNINTDESITFYTFLETNHRMIDVIILVRDGFIIIFFNMNLSIFYCKNRLGSMFSIFSLFKHVRTTGKPIADEWCCHNPDFFFIFFILFYLQGICRDPGNGKLTLLLV